MRTRPDSNVRPAPRAAAQSARGPGRFALARLLLAVAAKSLLLFALTSSMPACVIPVGPQWQDPDGIPNSPPEILSTDPPAGMMLSTTASAEIKFTLLVTDVNVTDHLYWEFIVDHRRATSINVIDPSPNGAPLRASLPQFIGCNEVQLGAPSPHPVRFFLADRQIDPASADLMDVAPPGKGVPADWWLNADCPSTSTQR